MPAPWEKYKSDTTASSEKKNDVYSGLVRKGKSMELKPDWSKVPIGMRAIPKEEPSIPQNIANRFNERVDLFKRNPVAGGIETANDMLGSVALPFMLGDMALQQLPYGQEMSNAVNLPFHAIAGGMDLATQGIQKGIDYMGVPQSIQDLGQTPENAQETSNALNTLNQGLAQFLIPALAHRGYHTIASKIQNRKPLSLSEIVQLEQVKKDIHKGLSETSQGINDKGEGSSFDVRQFGKQEPIERTNDYAISRFTQRTPDNVETSPINEAGKKPEVIPAQSEIVKPMKEGEGIEQGKEQFAKKEDKGEDIIDNVIDTKYIDDNSDGLLGNAGFVKDGNIVGYHITDNPHIIEDMLYKNQDIKTSRRSKDTGDLGGGIYFSGTPQLWTNRSTSKWDFLNNISKEQKNKLASSLLDKLNDESYYKYYLSNSERESAMRDVKLWKEGVGNNYYIERLSGQPYNIKFWEKEYLNQIGIKQDKIPQQIEIRVNGKFASLKRTPNENELKELREKYDGAYIKGGIAELPQFVIWNNDAIVRAGNYIRKQSRQPRVELDFAEQQKLKNAIQEGELLLKHKRTVSGRKYSADELEAIQRSVDNAKAKLPRVEGEKQPIEKNFVQWATERGLPTEYDTMFEAQLLGGRGLEGQRQSNRSIKAQDDAFHAKQKKAAEAKQQYENEIVEGKIIDPTGEVKREDILKRRFDYDAKELQSKIDVANSGIKQIEGLGKMSHLENGKLKRGYQRAVDDYNEKKQDAQIKLETLKDKYRQDLPVAEVSKPSEVPKQANPELQKETSQTKGKQKVVSSKGKKSKFADVSETMFPILSSLGKGEIAPSWKWKFPRDIESPNGKNFLHIAEEYGVIDPYHLDLRKPKKSGRVSSTYSQGLDEIARFHGFEDENSFLEAYGKEMQHYEEMQANKPRSDLGRRWSKDEYVVLDKLPDNQKQRIQDVAKVVSQTNSTGLPKEESQKALQEVQHDRGKEKTKRAQILIRESIKANEEGMLREYDSDVDTWFEYPLEDILEREYSKKDETNLDWLSDKADRELEKAVNEKPREFRMELSDVGQQDALKLSKGEDGGVEVYKRMIGNLKNDLDRGRITGKYENGETRLEVERKLHTAQSELSKREYTNATNEQKVAKGDVVKVKGKQGQFTVRSVDSKGSVEYKDKDQRSHFVSQNEVTKVGESFQVGDKIKVKKIKGEFEVKAVKEGLVQILDEKDRPHWVETKNASKVRSVDIQGRKNTPSGILSGGVIPGIDARTGEKAFNKIKTILVGGEKLNVRELPEGLEIVDGFYSPIEKITRQLLANKWGNGEQAWKEISNANGFKKEEAKWTGLEDWLKGKKNVTKQDILDYMKDNRVQIVEVVKGEKEKKFTTDSWVKGGENDNWLWQTKDGKYEISQDPDGSYTIYDENGESVERARNVDALKNSSNFDSDTKFSQYQLEGEKTNYREWYVILPREGRMKDVADWRVPSGHSSGDEIVDNRQLIRIRGAIRDGITEDGKKVKTLILEEGQSDRGQQGKKEGFVGDNKQLENSVFSLKVDNKGKFYFENKDKYELPIGRFDSPLDAFDKVKMQYGERTAWTPTNINEENRTLTLTKRDDRIPPAPFVTNTEHWLKLGLKTAIKQGVKDGVDRIAWTTGEQQNARYDLSKQVDKVYYNPETKEFGYFKIEEKNPEIRNGVNLEKLQDYVGKDVAERLLQQPLKDGMHELQGDDLKVGGKGMISFYGSPSTNETGIIGKVAKDLVKELTGKEGKIGETKIKLSDNLNAPFDITVKDENGRITTHNFDSKARASAWLSKEVSNGKKYEIISEKSQEEITSTQHSIEITPELKAAVKRGMPLFIAGGIALKGVLDDSTKYDLSFIPDKYKGLKRK